MATKISVFCILLCLSAGLAGATDRVGVRLESGILYRIVQPDEIHRMEKPAFVSVALAAAYMGEFEPVLGIARGDEARAYSVWLMEGYSVLNDAIAGVPIVVSWSPFSFSSTVFERVVDGDTLEFEDSGELWKEALVMVDRQTGSRWSHLEGRALDGPLKGKVLKPIQSTYTMWGLWRQMHVNTVCLTKLGRDITKSDFTTYYMRPQQLGPSDAPNPDSRLAGKELVCGFFVDGTPVVVPLYALLEEPQFTLNVNGTPLEIEFDPISETAVVYSRIVGRDTLDLVRLDFSKGESYLREKEGSTTWLTFSGRGVSGPRSDMALTQIPSTLCFWFVWASHYPLTQIWERPGDTPLE